MSPINIHSRAFLGLFFTIGLLSLFTSCGLKPSVNSTSGGSSRLYQSFFVGEDGTQYFINELLFEDRVNRNFMFADFTFRHNNLRRSPVTFNFSIKTAFYLSEIDSISLVTMDSSMILHDIKIMFTEKQKDEYLSRFTTLATLSDLKTFIQSTQPKILVFSKKNNSTLEFYPHKKTAKNIKKLDKDLFFIF